MAKDFDSIIRSQSVGEGKYEGALPSFRQPTSDFGEAITRPATDFSASMHRPVPSRQQTEIHDEMQDAIDAQNLPTPENYVHENPTVPRFIKNSGNAVKYLERNVVCRFVGGVGPRVAHRHRGWFMGCSACLSFTLLLLLIVPLLSNVASAEMTRAFSLGKGEAHWRLLIPLDWTNRMYFGLAGMTNVTKHGDSYFNRWDALECTEVFNDACLSCKDASGLVNLWVILGLIVILPAILFDVHRIFWAADLNFSKFCALILHLGCGVPFAVLALIGFLQKCFMVLPSYTVHMGEGRKNIGIDLIWHLDTVTWILLAIVVIRPFPGLLHLLVPTPNWANNRGLKVLEKKQRQEKENQDDQYAGMVNDMMAPEPGANHDTLRRPGDSELAVGDFDAVVKPQLGRRMSTSTDRSISAASAQGNGRDMETRPRAAEPLDAYEVQTVMGPTVTPLPRATLEETADTESEGQSERDSPRLQQRRATGEDLVGLGTVPASRRPSVLPGVFEDPFEEEHIADQEAAALEAAHAPEPAEQAPPPEEASVVTKKAGTKTKTKKKKGATELPATQKM